MPHRSAWHPRAIHDALASVSVRVPSISAPADRRTRERSSLGHPQDNVHGVYITPGFRLGGQALSLGAGLEIPLGSDEVEEFANIGVVVDLLFRFGS